MPWPDKYTLKQNPYIVGLQNYRDDMFKQFRVTPRNAFPMLMVVVVVPMSIMIGAKVEQDARAAKMKRDFPNLPPTLGDRWRERKKQKAAEAAQGKEEGHAADDGEQHEGDDQ